MRNQKEITDELADLVAKEAEVNKVTVLRGYVGLPVRGKTGVRVRRVLAAHGLIELCQENE